MAISAREREARKFRAAVIKRERSSLSFVEKQWRHSLKKIQADITRLTIRMELAAANGEPMSADWLRRQKEYRAMQENILAEANRLGIDTYNKLQPEVSWAAKQGASDYAALTQMSFATPVRGLVNFRALPTDTVLNIAGRVTPRSPTGQLLGKLGRDTADASRKVLIDGITRGKNVRVIGRELTRVSGLPASRAKSIATTEIFGAYTDTAHEHMKANSDILESWIWMCQLGSACGACLGMHGEELSLDEFIKKHPNCHCEPVPKPKSFAALGLPSFLDDDYPDPMQPAQMKKDALAQLSVPKADLEKRFGKGKADLLTSGKVKLEDLVTETHSKVWGDAVVETPLKDLIKKSP